jgi:diguanylate cyclase (GGDEF)-like protein/PAS domain S-box-containing protein
MTRLRWSRLVPRARLSDESFHARHRALQIILWLQLPFLLFFGLRDSAGVGTMAGMPHAVAAETLVRLMIVAMAGCAVAGVVLHGRRIGAATVSLGLLLGCALLVSIGGGRTDLHFAYFLAVGLISLYQDWLPLLMAVVLVTAEHLVMGLTAPMLLYSDREAIDEPIRYAFLHAGFVLGICAIQVVYWHFADRSQRENDRVRADADRQLRSNAERYEALVQDSSDVITVVDAGGLIMSASAAVQRIMGYPPAELIGTPYRELIHPEDRGQLREGPGSEEAEYRAEARARHADGGWYWHDLTVRDLTGNPAVAGVVINHRDVTERRAFQERLVYEASHDALTALANRGELLRTLEQRLAEAPGDGSRVGVLYLDLDGFKQVNDTHGHDAGDALLVAVADSLRRCVLGGDVVGRLGGDEFAVVLNQVTSVEDTVAVAKRILADLARPVRVSGVELRPRASVGIALAERGRAETDELLHRADTAMYHAKREGTTGWQLYVEGMHDPSTTTGTLEDELRHAVDGGQLVLHYQPVVVLENGELVGFEALVRWQHPVLGLLQPDDFIPLAEQSDLIDRVGGWVLAQACRQVRRWQPRITEGPRLTLSVNMSRRQLESPALVRDVLDTLETAGYLPSDLVIEVAESAVVDAEPLLAQMTGLHAHGISFALDDFGTGYSSLRHLASLPIDVLKLDTYFVTALDGTSEGSAVAEAVIRLGRALHLDTVAEGVESRAQATELTLLGCRTGQGFHYAYPMPAEHVDAMLDAMPLGRRPNLPVTLTPTIHPA